MLRHAAKVSFAESRMTIGAGDNDGSADIGGYSIQLGRHIPLLIHVGHQL